MIINWLQRHERIGDALLVLAALAATVGAAARYHQRAIGIPLALLACFPLLARRRWPLLVLGVTTAATHAIAGVSGIYTPFPVGVALFTVATLCERTTALIAGLVAIATLTPTLWNSVGWSHPGDVVVRVLGFALAWLIGDSIGTRRRYVAALEERAERLEREREAEAARAVAEEQARIARELHDVLAHNVAVMVVQAAAGSDAFETRPQRARQALEAIETTGRGALAELRRVLGAISAGGGAAFTPEPGLDRLDELLDQVRATGLEVSLTVEGTRRALPAGVDLSAYRLVQEALTNTLKHARATRADVVLRYGDHDVDVEVRDNGTGAVDTKGSGRGLTGMRERVGTFGGSMSAGPAGAGGFAVVARLPIGADA
jgi:signal transduction histidine kinase